MFAPSDITTIISPSIRSLYAVRRFFSPDSHLPIFSIARYRFVGVRLSRQVCVNESGTPIHLLTDSVSRFPKQPLKLSANAGENEQ
jgi:hypothetical protein